MATINGMECKVLGKTEAERPCDICGTNMLKTAVVVEVDNGHQMHIGRDCAAMAIHGSKSSTNQTKVDKAVRQAQHESSQRIKLDLQQFSNRFQTSKGDALNAFRKTGRKFTGATFATRGPFVIVVENRSDDLERFIDRLGFKMVGNPFPAI